MEYLLRSGKGEEAWVWFTDVSADTSWTWTTEVPAKPSALRLKDKGDRSWHLWAKKKSYVYPLWPHKNTLTHTNTPVWRWNESRTTAINKSIWKGEKWEAQSSHWSITTLNSHWANVPLKLFPKKRPEISEAYNQNKCVSIHSDVLCRSATPTFSR